MIACFRTRGAAQKAAPKWRHKVLVKKFRGCWFITYIPNSIFPTHQRVLLNDGSWGRHECLQT